MNQEKIGSYFQSKRKELNLTQKELATKLRVSDKSISKWERGVCLPDICLFDDICNVFNISLVELLKGEDVEDDKKINEVENELKKSIIYKSKVYKLFNIISYLLVFTGIILFLISNYKLGPKKFFYSKYIIYFFISLFGFILIMYQSNKSPFKKLFKTVLFSLIYSIFAIIVLLFNFNFIIGPKNPKNILVYHQFVVSEKYVNLSDEDIVESGSLAEYRKNPFIYIYYYDIGLPFIKEFRKFYDENDKYLDIFYGDDLPDNKLYNRIKNKFYKKYKLKFEKYDSVVNDYPILSIKSFNNPFINVYVTKNGYAVYSDDENIFYGFYKKENYKTLNSFVSKLLDIYSSVFKSDIYIITDSSDELVRLIYDKDLNYLGKY